jgi:hypothetical protein
LHETQDHNRSRRSVARDADWLRADLNTPSAPDLNTPSAPDETDGSGVETPQETPDQHGVETPQKTSDQHVAEAPGSWVYPDGFKVRVSKLAAFKPSEDSSPSVRGNNIGLLVVVKLSNGTSDTADATLTTVSLAYGKDGKQAKLIFDSGGPIEIDGGFDGRIAAGRNATARFGFKVPKSQTDQLHINVEPGFVDYAPAVFTGSAQ